MSWMEHANCNGTDLDFIDYEDTDEARDELLEVCRACTVREDCLTTAFKISKDVAGIWGGTTVTQRRAIDKKQFDSPPRYGYRPVS